MDLEITEDLILARINNLINGMKLDQVPLNATLNDSKLNTNFVHKYQIQNDPSNATFTITSLWDIGWADPYAI